MDNSEVSVGEFDLLPDPRVLPMLGEINLDHWRCVAELVDNAIDGFLHALRAGVPVEAPEVIVTLPTAAVSNARVQVRDNGPGMTPQILEQAVSAGWTGNNPIDNLGLFGMGFNIATARLGALTRVWTTRTGDHQWHGLEINFEELLRRRSFRTSHLIRPKSDPAEQGTEVTVERLKPDQLQALTRTATQSRIRDQLEKAYSAMLRPGGKPLEFSLHLNGRRLAGRAHCVWDENRSAPLPALGEVPAVITIDTTLPTRPYCLRCMQWLPAGQTECVSPDCQIVARERRVHGWIGLQRYLHETDFGFDFIRNGRKIEFAVRELFDWTVDGASEREYPVDDPRFRGRIVGEIHLDHCRVHYDKTRFERTDPAWEDMTQIVRGQGPLRPEKAGRLGFGPNSSPLYRLFQAFRRNGPKQRNGTGWSRLLVVRENERALEMARSFRDGRPEYQSDTKWWELVQADDLNDLRGIGDGSRPPSGGIPTGFVDSDDDGGTAAATTTSPSSPASAADPVAPTIVVPPPPPREPAPDLTRVYEAAGGPRISVDASAVTRVDPGLGHRPWIFELASAATRTYRFLFDPTNPVFRSATFSPRDALLAELARHVVETTRGSGAAIDFPSSLADMRTRYARGDDLDPRSIVQEAAQALTDMARSIRGRIDEEAGATLFNEFSPEDQQAVLRRMAQRGVTTPASQVADGGFLEFLDRHGLRHFFEQHPELFLDGRYWDDPYSAIDFGDGATTDMARRRVVERIASLVADAVWVADLDPADLARVSRDELLRAALSIRLLRPDVEPA